MRVRRIDAASDWMILSVMYYFIGYVRIVGRRAKPSPSREGLGASTQLAQ